MENAYEGMFLLDSGKYAADSEGVTGTLLGILERCGAHVDAHRPWQDGKLAYPIEGHRKGLHYLTYFRMETSRLGEVAHLCKLNDVILRHIVIKQPPELFDLMVDALKTEESRTSGGSESHPPREKSKQVATTEASDAGDNT